MLEHSDLEDVEVQSNGRWRTFVIKVGQQEVMRAKGWGRHVPNYPEALAFVYGEDV